MAGPMKRWTGAAVTALLATVPMHAAFPCQHAPVDRIPPRPADAPGGAAFVQSLAAVQPEDRETAIVTEVLRGNIPDFLRTLVPIELTDAPARSPRARTARVCVMPDYLAIGGDEDYVRMPMNLHSSTQIAREFGFILPTGRIVDAIHAQADYRFSPQPLKPGKQMVQPDYFLSHESRIRAQAAREGAAAGMLLAGHKKDVVLSNRLNQRAGRIAIYGWHYRDGTPIQPLSTVHHAGYADYSHGIRLVSDVVIIDGRRHSVFDVLQNHDHANLLSDEGPMPNPRALMGEPPEGLQGP